MARLHRRIDRQQRGEAMELPTRAEAARRALAADCAVGELAALVARASLYGPEDAPHVFERCFAEFRRAHLHPAGGGHAPAPPARRAVPQRA